MKQNIVQTKETLEIGHGNTHTHTILQGEESGLRAQKWLREASQRDLSQDLVVAV